MRVKEQTLLHAKEALIEYDSAKRESDQLAKQMDNLRDDVRGFLSELCTSSLDADLPDDPNYMIRASITSMTKSIAVLSNARKVLSKEQLKSICTIVIDMKKLDALFEMGEITLEQVQKIVETSNTDVLRIQRVKK